MPSNDLVALYIAELRAIRSTGSATAETSYYPPVDRLFNAVGQTLRPSVLFSTQLRNSGAGMPDGGFFPQHTRQRRNAEPLPLLNPERGVVEIKPADYSLDALTGEPQTLRYLQQYGLVLITNLREFRLLQFSAGTVRTLERYALASNAAALWTNPIASFERHAELFPDFLRRVMLHRAPLAQPKDVAWLLASYAREARARAEDHPLASFDAVKRALQESLGIRFEGDKGEHFSDPPLFKRFSTESFQLGFCGIALRKAESPMPASIGEFQPTTSVCRFFGSCLGRLPIRVH